MEPLQAPEGEIVATHPATVFGRILAGLMMLLPGAGLVALAAQHGGADADARVPAIAGGLTLLALGILAFVQQNRSRVVVRTDGAERWGLRGKLWALRWADMVELRYRAVKMRIYHVIPAGTHIYLTLTDPNGKKCRVPSNMKGMELLAERIADQQTNARFAAARAAVDRGEEVRFGKALIVDGEKLSARKLFGGYKTCPLSEIEKVAVEGGFLRIRQRGKFLGFGGGNVGAIPNVFLFLRLLDSLIARSSAIPQDRDFAARANVG
jgi:uncharacterized protein DUF6585